MFSTVGISTNTVLLGRLLACDGTVLSLSEFWQRKRVCSAELRQEVSLVLQRVESAQLVAPRWQRPQ